MITLEQVATFADAVRRTVDDDDDETAARKLAELAIIVLDNAIKRDDPNLMAVFADEYLPSDL